MSNTAKLGSLSQRKRTDQPLMVKVGLLDGCHCLIDELVICCLLLASKGNRLGRAGNRISEKKDKMTLISRALSPTLPIILDQNFEKFFKV